MFIEYIYIYIIVQNPSNCKISRWAHHLKKKNSHRNRVKPRTVIPSPRGRFLWRWQLIVDYRLVSGARRANETRLEAKSNQRRQGGDKGRKGWNRARTGEGWKGEGGSAKAHGMEEEGEITHAASGITALWFSDKNVKISCLRHV